MNRKNLYTRCAQWLHTAFVERCKQERMTRTDALALLMYGYASKQIDLAQLRRP